METVTSSLHALLQAGVKLTLEQDELVCYAPPGVLTGHLRANIFEHRDVLIGLLRQRLARASGDDAIPPADRSGILPLSYAQERLWFIEQMAPGGPGYNIPGAVRIRMHVDPDGLRNGLARLVARHESLRTVFPSRDGEPFQLILPAVEVPLVFHDLRQLPESSREQIARRLCVEEAQRGFELSNGPLIRALLLRLKQDESVLLLNLHHIVGDGWSIGILMEDLAAILGAGEHILPELPVQYADFAMWQRRWLKEGSGLAADLDYWKRQLAGMPASIDLPTDFPRPTERRDVGATLRFRLDALLASRLKQFARAREGTLFMALLAALNAVLYRYTGQRDICIGTAVANRRHMATSRLIGMFVNTLPLRTSVDPAATFEKLFDQTRQTCLDAYARQDAPFEKIVEAVAPARSLATTPLFQVMLLVQEAARNGAAPGTEPFLFETGVSKFDLSLEFTETKDGIDGLIEYSTDMFAPDRMARLSRHYATILDVLLAKPQTQIDDVEFLGPERDQVLRQFNATDKPLAPGERAHDAFVRQALSEPARTALRMEDVGISYGELLAQVLKLATDLKKAGTATGDVIGLCVDRTPAMVIGMLAVFMAGGVFLPLDPNYPAERLRYMLGDSHARLIVTDGLGEAALEGIAEASPCRISYDWRASSGVADIVEALSSFDAEPTPADAAYVIYTSGSTGKPKGVVVEHRSLVNHNRFAADHYQLDATDVQILVSSLSFDLFLEEVLSFLRAGAALVLAPRERILSPSALEVLAVEFGVTTLNLPTALFHELVTAECRLPSVRRVIVGGERLDARKAAKFFDSASSRVLYNTYGPTETTVISTSARVTREVFEAAETVPIGRPIDNTQIYILDSRRRPVPIGIPGEICISGTGLARGYLGRADLTRERFVRNPFNPGTRMYRTGDLGCWRHDGQIEYLGRTDKQVKIRGFRVEPAEIEAALVEHPAVLDAAVVAQEHAEGKCLVAFWRAADPSADPRPDSEALRTYLRQRLPDYLVPQVCVQLAEWPLTPNGKVDIRQLEQTGIVIDHSREFIAPRNDIEQRLAAIWSQVLNLPPESIGVHSDFFELGGHSLLATRLVSRLRTHFDVDLPLRTLFESSTLVRLAEALAGAMRSQVPPIRPVAREQALPLSFAQERLWFLQQLEPDSVAYNVPGAVRIRGRTVQAVSLQAALTRLVARHESLRTVFPSENGQPRQQVLPAAEADLRVIDLGDRPPAGREADAVRVCQAEAATPFDLASGPLLRSRLIRLATDEHVLMLHMHHIISDSWSIGVLLGELGRLLADPSAALPALPIQYADYAVWQRRWLDEGGVLARQLGYWTTQLAGLPESLELIPDYPRPAERSAAGATRSFRLDADRLGALKAHAEAHGATLYMALLALVKALLYRYTAQEDLCIGSPVANRQYGETEGLVGMFVNTLPLRTRVRGQESFDALLADVARTCLDAYEHQDTPFERIVEAVRPHRNRAISPLFQVMVVLQNTEAVTLPDGVQPLDLDEGVAKFDLSFEFQETAAGLAGAITYSTELYSAERIERMAAHLGMLCASALHSPGQALDTLRYLAEDERTYLVHTLNETARAFPRERRIHDFVLEQMAAAPERVAVVTAQETLTYGELDARSLALARVLQARGAGPDTIVGLCAERSVAMVVGILGIVRAGAAYLPLDPSYPADRLSYMLENSAVGVVLTQAHLRNTIAPLLTASTALYCLDSEWPAIVEEAAHLPYDDSASATNLCYVLYTSGSTGRPKGVLTEHRALVNQLHWRQRRYGLTADDVVLQKTPYSFDVSVWEFFWPLMVGARLVMAAPEGHRDVAYLDRLIATHGITTLHFVPSMFTAFLENGQAVHPSVRRIICSGEALGRKAATGYRTRFPEANLYNLYGPTEAAIDVTAHDCTDLVSATVPIGRPMDNTRIYILDPRGEPQPVGVPGELHIAGAGLARGYLHRPDLTAERFVTDPFFPGERMYRSGDLARWTEEGILEYLGRIDTQVKLRGLRVELGEIEAQMEAHPGIETAVVILREQSLVAFYRAAGEPPANEALRTHLAQTLPDYMVPARFVALDALPLTSSGKADRRALGALQVAVDTAAPVAPRTDDERRLAELWAEVLNLPPESIGVHSDFFELGGHSLLAVRLMAGIERCFGTLLPLAILFAAPTIAELARRLGGPALAEQDAVLVPIQRGGTAQPVFVMPGVGGNVLSFQPLARALGSGQPLYGLQAVGLDGLAAPLESVEETAQKNVKAIRSIQPSGPYRLLGHSYGGVVAVETSRLLLEQGETIEKIVLVDAFATAIAAGDVAMDDADVLSDLCSTLGELNGRTVSMPAGSLRGKSAQEIVSALAQQGIDVGVEQFEILLRVFEASRRAYASYEPTPLPEDVPVTLYRASADRQADGRQADEHGWCRVLRGPLRVVDIDAGHFSILAPPAIDLIARDLQAADTEIADAAGMPSYKEQEPCD